MVLNHLTRPLPLRIGSARHGSASCLVFRVLVPSFLESRDNLVLSPSTRPTVQSFLLSRFHHVFRSCLIHLRFQAIENGLHSLCSCCDASFHSRIFIARMRDLIIAGEAIYRVAKVSRNGLDMDEHVISIGGLC